MAPPKVMRSAPSSTAPALSSAYAGRVVCVDLDGTLTSSDLLWEGFVELLKRQPLRALRAVMAVWRGKAAFKQRVAALAPCDARALPFRDEVMDHLHALHRSGACLVLATAADEGYARAVAAHVGIFSDVVASDGRVNLAGARKASALVARYGAAGFDYIGNGRADIPVWRAAARRVGVAVPPNVARRVQGDRPLDRIGPAQPTVTRALLRALRPYQWVKNLLVFIPLVTSHTLFSYDAWASSTVTFVVFCLAASAIYILNDISDLKADRAHHRKRTRPFAAGDLSIPLGLATALLLLLGATAVALTVSSALALVLAAYIVATIAYSAGLKRLPVADVFTLTGLYVLRIVAGGVAAAIFPSSWLLAFGLFFFLSLAFVKRYAELVTTAGWVVGRGYGPDDATWMHAIGTCAGYMAVVVLALYVSAPDVTILYSRPQVLWLLCPLLLFWMTRLWFRTGRRLVHDDPVIDALNDPTSWGTALAGLLIMFAAV